MSRKRKPVANNAELKTFAVQVKETVEATVEVKVRAKSAKEAAQRAHDAWVRDGVGELSEAVLERWTEVDGVAYNTVDRV